MPRICEAIAVALSDQRISQAELARRLNITRPGDHAEGEHRPSKSQTDPFHAFFTARFGFGGTSVVSIGSPCTTTGTGSSD